MAKVLYNPEIHGQLKTTASSPEPVVKNRVLYNPKEHGEMKPVLNEYGDNRPSLKASPPPPSYATQIADGIITGVLNAPRNIVSTFNDLAKGTLTEEEKLRRQQTGETGLGDKILKNIPEFKPPVETQTSRTASEISGAITGGVLGGSVMAPIKGANVVSNVANLVGRGILGNFGAASAMDEDASKLLYGQNGVLQQWGFDEKGTVDEVKLEKRLNLLADAMTVSGLIAGPAIAAKKTIGDFVLSPTAKGIVEFFKPEAQNKFVSRNIIKIIGGIDETVDSPEIIQQKIKTVANMLRTNKPVEIPFDEAIPGMKKQLVKRDTATFMTEALAGSGENASLIADINNLKKAAKGPITEGQVQLPMRSLKEASDEMTSIFGGVKEGSFVDRAGEQISKNADLKYVRPLQENLGKFLSQQKDLSKTLSNELNSNEEFLKQAIKITGDIDLDITKKSDNMIYGITEKLMQKSREMTEIKNSKYAEIGKLQIVGSAKPIEKAISDLGRFQKILDKDLLKEIQESGYKLYDLERLANFDVTDVIETLKGNDRFTAAAAISKLKKAMTVDQFEFVKRSKKKGGAAALRAVKEAERFYKEEFLPWRTNPILDKIISSELGNSLDKTQKLATASDSLYSGLSLTASTPGNRLQSDQVIDFVEKNLGRVDTDKIADWAVLEVAKDYQKILNRSGELSYDELLKSLPSAERLAAVFSKSSPERYSKFENFLTKMRNGLLKQNELDLYVNGLEAEVKAAQKETFENFLDEFSTKSGVVPNSYEGFKALFMKVGNEDRINKMLDLIKEDAFATNGMKAAFNDILTDNFFFKPTGSQLSSGARAPNLSGVYEFLQPNSSIGRYSESILGPKVTELYRQSVKLVFDISKVTPGKQDLGMHLGQIDKNASSAINRVITWVWGVLNPAAARIRTVTSQYLEANPTSPAMREYLDKVMSNSDLLLDTADEMVKKNKYILTFNQKQALKRGLFRGAITASDDTPITPVEEETEEVFGNDKK